MKTQTSTATLPIRNLIAGLILCAGLLVFCSQRESLSAGTDPIEWSSLKKEIAAGKPIYLQDRTILGEVDFTSLQAYALSAESQVVEVGVPITLIHCRFKGAVTAQKPGTVVQFNKNLSLINCDFEQGVRLDGIRVLGTAIFRESAFHQDLFCRGARFQGVVDAKQAKFADEAAFQECRFQESANFSGVEAGNTLSLQSASFNRDVQFANAKLNASLDASNARFDGPALFNYSEISGKALFGHAQFRDRAEFYKIQARAAIDFSDTRFWNKATWQEANCQQDLDLRQAQFLADKPNLKDLSFAAGTQVLR